MGVMSMRMIEKIIVYAVSRLAWSAFLSFCCLRTEKQTFSSCLWCSISSCDRSSSFGRCCWCAIIPLLSWRIWCGRGRSCPLRDSCCIFLCWLYDSICGCSCGWSRPCPLMRSLLLVCWLLICRESWWLDFALGWVNWILSCFLSDLICGSVRTFRRFCR